MDSRSLHDRLRAIGLFACADSLDDLIAHMTKARFGPAQIFEHIVELEDMDRARRSLERRLTRSKIGRFKPIADFDWAWPTRIDKNLVDAALRLGFLESARNVVLIANQGLGKTTLAQNIAHNAILAGHSVLFVSAAQLLLDLGSQESTRALDRRLRLYANVPLLVVDEVGFLAYDARNADLLFQVVSRRYERKPIILTTNLAFRNWPTIFPNATCATALVDRIIHHADVIRIEGKSYRLRDAMEDTPAAPTAKPPTLPQAPTPKRPGRRQP